MAMVSINGQMVDSMMESGKIICSMGRENIHGLMVECMTAIIGTTTRRDLVFTYGQMPKSMRDTGKMEKDMDKADILI